MIPERNDQQDLRGHSLQYRVRYSRHCSSFMDPTMDSTGLLLPLHRTRPLLYFLSPIFIRTG